MAMSNIFQTESPPQIPSYDWFDLVSKTGYKMYYPASADISGADLHFLTPFDIEGDYNLRTILSSGTERDFDLTFNFPAIVRGDFIFAYFIYLANGSSLTVTLTVYKVVDGVETQICQVSDGGMSNSSGAGRYYRRLTFATAANTTFASGDIIRLNVLLTGSGTMGVYYDPSGRQSYTEDAAGATIDSKFKVMIPFRVDI